MPLFPHKTYWNSGIFWLSGKILGRFFSSIVFCIFAL